MCIDSSNLIFVDGLIYCLQLGTVVDVQVLGDL